MTPEQSIERARRAKLAMDEFLEPALEVIEADYAEKMIEVAASSNPRATEIIARLANGVSVTRQIRSQIMNIIADGDVSTRAIARTQREEEMTPAKLRLLKIGQV